MGSVSGVSKRRGVRLEPLILSDEDRSVLAGWVRRRKTAQALAFRSRIVLACAGDPAPAIVHVARDLATSPDTVRKWRRRFQASGLEGLVDEPRPGKPRTITDEQVERVVVDTLESTPVNATHWSRALMAEKSGLSKRTIGRIWDAFGLQPHRVETFKLSRDPLFIDKVVDIVGLYCDPPERAVVLCADEKSQIQALDRTQPVLPMAPGVPERRSHDYVRNGVTSLFAAFDIATGKVISALHRRHRSVEWLKFLRRIDKAVPADVDIHLICDNYATHKTEPVQRWLARHPRFHVHFTPTSASWLNQVERFFALITTKLLQRGVHTSVTALEKDLRTWIKQYNQDPKPFIWTKTAEEILDSIKRFCLRISAPGH